MISSTIKTKLLFSLFAGGAVVVGSWVLGYFVHLELNDAKGFPLTLLTGVSAVAIGWFLGFLASPLDKTEEKRFNKYASYIAAFFSGYLLSKLEPSLEAIFAGGNLAKDPVYAARALIFLTSFSTSAITMFAYRKSLL